MFFDILPLYFFEWFAVSGFIRVFLFGLKFALSFALYDVCKSWRCLLGSGAVQPDRAIKLKWSLP
jgi:hypothetical protein